MKATNIYRAMAQDALARYFKENTHTRDYLEELSARVRDEGPEEYQKEISDTARMIRYQIAREIKFSDAGAQGRLLGEVAEAVRDKILTGEA